MQQRDKYAWDDSGEECLTFAPAIIATTRATAEFSVEELAAVEEFLTVVPNYQETELIEWDFGIDDYGQENVYAVIPDANGGYQLVELCRFGGECVWIDDAEVREFVTMLIDAGYYGDADIFRFYLEYYQ